MYRILLALALASALAACSTTESCSSGTPTSSDTTNCVGGGTQPLVDDPSSTDADPADEDATADSSDTTSANERFASDFGDDDLRLNSVTYDAAKDELRLNNLPFDGGDNLYEQNAALSTAVGSPFDIYENTETSSTRFPTNYYAVFRRTSSGYSQVTAVGTDSYIDFAYGGAAAQRLNDSTSLPATPESYAFTGEYAAVRTVIDDSGSNTDSYVQYVSGVVEMKVDIEDFDPDDDGQTGGAVGALVVGREFFDANGVQINMDRGGATSGGPDYITLHDATINFDDWTINSSSATVVSNDDVYSNTATGNWQGLFTGPNGEEVAGIVVVEGNGPIGIDPTTGEYIEVQVREVGGFTAVQN